MKKCMILLITVALSICVLSACGEDSKPDKNNQNGSEKVQEVVNIKEEIIGEWHLSEKSKHVDQEFYPEENVLIFSEDGTWNNKKTNTYIIADESIVMDSRWWASQYTYVISISDDVLMLQYPGEEALYFNKVK